MEDKQHAGFLIAYTERILAFPGRQFGLFLPVSAGFEDSL